MFLKKIYPEVILFCD